MSKEVFSGVCIFPLSLYVQLLGIQIFSHIMYAYIICHKIKLDLGFIDKWEKSLSQNLQIQSIFVVCNCMQLICLLVYPGEVDQYFVHMHIYTQF